MTTTETDAKAAFAARLKEFEGRQIGPPDRGADAVNQAMIRHWVEAIGDQNPVYVDPDAAATSVHKQIVAPPVMLQAWVMRGFKPRPRTGGSVQDELMALLEGEGFTSVVATNCEQEYARYVHLGDHLSTTTIIESVSDEKATGLGVGHFVTTRVEYRTESSSSSPGLGGPRPSRPPKTDRCVRVPPSRKTTPSSSRVRSSTAF
jgi:hypothetical protein